jgi:hypothetical protein
MAKKIPYAFGVSGDLTPVPDTSTSTELSYQDGWSPDYEKSPEEAGYREIDRGQHNQLWNTVTANIKEWQEQLYPEHQPDTIYPVGSIARYSGVNYLRVGGTTVTADPSVSNEWVVYSSITETTPINNQYNGFFTVDHLSLLPSPAGLPATSGSGGTAYTVGQEWSKDNFATGGTISLDDDGLIFSAGIYKLFTFTAEQLALIDITMVPVYIVGDDGSRHFLKHDGTDVVVTKPDSTTLKVQINASILTTLSITKIFSFFVTDDGGFVSQLSPGDTIVAVLGAVAYDLSTNGYQVLPSGLIVQWGSYTSSNTASITVNFPIPFPNAPLSVVATLRGGTSGSDATLFTARSPTVDGFQLNGFTSSTGARVAHSCSVVAIGY